MPLLAKNNRQLARFGLVGILNTIIDFGVLFFLKYLGIPIGLANIASTTAAFLFSFAANKRYTFQTSGTSIIREVILFIIVTLFGLWVIQTIIIQISLPALAGLTGNVNIGLLIAKLVATGASLVWNYLLYSRLVFRKY